MNAPVKKRAYSVAIAATKGNQIRAVTAVAIAAYPEDAVTEAVEKLKKSHPDWFVQAAVAERIRPYLIESAAKETAE
jgi:beta-phosphoglucomutase-like phosphatase (HAD superfamily)